MNRKTLITVTSTLMIASYALCQNVKIAFGAKNEWIRQCEIMGVHDGELYVNGMGANVYKYDAKSGELNKTEPYVDKTMKGKYFTADQLQAIMTEDAIYTVYFKKAGGKYDMTMGKYDFNQQAIIPDKSIDNTLANTSYYSIEENYVNLTEMNGKIYVKLYNLNGNTKSICVYELDQDLNLISSIKVPLTKEKSSQYFDKFLVCPDGDIWLVRDLKINNYKASWYFFDNRYSQMTSDISNYDFYRFYKDDGALVAQNFSYKSSMTNPNGANFYTYANNLVMGTNTMNGTSIFVELNEKNTQSGSEINLTVPTEAVKYLKSERASYVATLAGTTKSGGCIFSSFAFDGSTECSFIEEVKADGSRRIFTGTLIDKKYSYVHVNNKENYILGISLQDKNIVAVVVDITTGKETITEIKNIAYPANFTCKITNLGNYYGGYWFDDAFAYTGGVFVMRVEKK